MRHPTTRTSTDGPPLPFGVLVLFAAAVLYLLAAQLNPAAPLRQGLNGETWISRQAQGRAAVVGPVERLADGRNVELHFADAAPSDRSGVVSSGVYYGLNYAMFPARAFVGDDRSVVNDAATLRAADRLPSEGWLRDHGVVAVVTFPVDAAGLHKPTARPVR